MILYGKEKNKHRFERKKKAEIEYENINKKRKE